MAGWTPSIIPGGDSETVYLVADDFGDLGRCWRETDFETAADLEAIITDLLNDQGWWASTPLKVGPAMSPKMSPPNCCTAVTGKGTTFRPVWRALSSGMYGETAPSYG